MDLSDILIFIAVATIVFLARNNAVYCARTAILDIEPVTVGLQLHRSLPSYDAMLFHPKYWTLWTARHWMLWLNRRGMQA